MKARNSDQISLNRALRQRLHDRTDPPNEKGCMLYHPMPGESAQILVEIAGLRGLHICSVRRVAWAFAHEHEVGWENGRLRGCLGPHEEVITLCGTIGDDDTADGQCVNPDHLGRGDCRARVKLHHARRSIDQVVEATR